MVKVISRRNYRRWAAVAAALLAAAVMAYGALVVRPLETAGSDGRAAAENSGRVAGPSLYVPLWLDAAAYERIAKLPLAESRADAILAFAEPSADGRLKPPTVPAGVGRVVRALHPEARLALAVGGWGGNPTVRQQMLDGFAAAGQQPQAFAADVKAAAEAAGRAAGRPVTDIDIDWEYPRAEQAAALTAIVAAVRQAMPAAHISLAVPAANNIEGFAAALPVLSRQVGSYHVMTYDQTTPYDGSGSRSGPLAEGRWAAAAYRSWLQRVRAVSADAEVAVGFPAYCYRYAGATAAGQAYRSGDQLPYHMVDTTGLKTQADGTLAGLVDGDWASCAGPEAAGRLRDALAPAYGSLPPSFVWSAEGLTDEYLSVLGPRR